MTRSLLLPLTFITLLTLGCDQQRFSVSSAAMEPTIAAGEVIVLDTTATTPGRWDVIMFRAVHNPDILSVSRVVGLPGETVAFDGVGLLINGSPVSAPARLARIGYQLAPDGDVAAMADQLLPHPFTVPADAYYVLGDNVKKAYDSRFRGGVPASHVMGTVRGK